MNHPQTKKAVVTGGTSGIGRATSIALMEAGYEVIATGVFEHEIEDCAKDPAMEKAELKILDVGDNDAVTAFFSSLNQLDALVNCAGIGRGQGEFSTDGFTQTMDININGTMRCCYAAKPLLQKSRGAIVNIGSIMSIMGSGTAPAYSASKGAVLQFTKSLAVAWASEGIRVNAIAPGWIETPMTKGIMAGDQERNRKVLERTPMERWGKPQEIANGVAFLVSDKASFITGVLLPIDGGYVAKAI